MLTGNFSQPNASDTIHTPGEISVVKDERRAAFFRHLTAYALVNVGLAILNLSRNPGHLWFHWVLMGWGIGIACHALKVFCFSEKVR
jgi:hypothetical protein